MTFLTDRFGVTSTDNSTTATLGATGTYTGTGEVVENYGDVTVNVNSDQDSAAGGLQLQFSSNGTDWDIIESQSYLSALGAQVVNTNVKGKYFRIVYVNGGQAQTTFRLQTIYQQAKTSVGGGGGGNEITFNDAFLDAFGRLKVSEPQTLLDITHTKDKNNLLISEFIGGTGTSVHDEPSSSVLMSVSSNSDRVIRQTRKYTIYQPGKSLQIILTGVINAGSNGNSTTSRIGYYDDENGIFFEYSGGLLYFVKRNNGVDTKIVQSNWNVDQVDGDGNSGMNLDVSKTQIFVIDIEWLGVGRVRGGVFHQGSLILVHEFFHSNIETNTYMQTANLPVRYEITSSGDSGSLRHICATVISDGGYNPTGKIFAANRGITTATVTSGSPEPILSLRLKSSGETGAEPRTTVNLKQFSIASTNTTGKITVANVYLVQDAATPLTTPTWVSADEESAVEYDISSESLDTTNSLLVQSLYFSNRIEIFSSSIESLIPLTTNIGTTGSTGISDIISIVVNPVGGGNIDYLASATWEELF